MIGKNNPFYGKHHTKDVRERIANAIGKEIGLSFLERIIIDGILIEKRL